MSDEEIKETLEKNRDREIQERLIAGLSETKDGSHIFARDSQGKDIFDKKLTAIIPRTVSAQINFSNILEDMIKNIDFVSNYSYDAMCRGVLVLLNHIPDDDADDQFREEVENSKYIEKIPSGRYGGFGGNTYEIMEEHETYDFLGIYRAIFNLLRRRGTYTTPRLWNERKVGVMFTRKGENAPVEHEEDKIVGSETE